MKAYTKAPVRAGFAGGTLAGAATVGATALGRPVGLVSAEDFPPPETWQGMFGGPRGRAVAGGSALFALGGGVWGALFAALVKDPTPAKGALFGVLPLLYEGAIVAPIMGKRPFFGGQALPNALGVVGNCLVWGTLVGRYCQKHAVPAGAEDSDRASADGRTIVTTGPEGRAERS